MTDQGHKAEGSGAALAMDRRWMRDLARTMEMVDKVVLVLDKLVERELLEPDFGPALAEWKQRHVGEDGLHPLERRLNGIFLDGVEETKLREEVAALRREIQQMGDHGLQGKQLELKLRVLEEQYAELKDWIDDQQTADFVKNVRAPATAFMENAATLAGSLPTIGGPLSELLGFGRTELNKKR